ncbi:MAG: phosphoribosylglycinamide formyltransferase [Actinomycetota bacterium]
MAGAPLKIGVLVSGTGSLLESILEGSDANYEVVVVISDRDAIEALARAERYGVPPIVIDFKSFDSREAFSQEVARVERAYGVELAVHAGFMRVLAPVYFSTLGVPAMNSHPALLPSFPGAHPVREALERGVKVTGTTIHFVDEGVDTGAIIAQQAVPIMPGDSEESLHERIKKVERQLYPEVIRLYAQGRIKLEGRRVHVIG